MSVECKRYNRCWDCPYPKWVRLFVNFTDSVLTSDLTSAVTQAKVTFLTQAKNRNVRELVVSPVYLMCSLSDRIKPRWFFLATYCKDHPFILSTHLLPTDKKFLTASTLPPWMRNARVGC